MTLLVQGASYSLYTCHSIHTWPYFTWSSVLLLSLISYLSVYITIRFIIHSFQCSNYITFYFHISILLFSLLVCALTGSLLTDLDFSASELEETDEPLFEGIQEDYQAWVWHFFVLCILAFCLVMMSRCQSCIFFYFCFVMFQILYPDKKYCRRMPFMWKWNFWLSFVYVC